MATYMKAGIPFLFDSISNEVVGIKQANGNEMLFGSLGNGYVDSAVIANGGNAAFRANNQKGMLLIKPAALIATGNIVLPPDALSDVGQELFVAFYKVITLTTIVNGVLMGDPTTGGIGDIWHIKKLEAGIWGKIT